MSDLAPFVAAVLRDKVILDQLEEMKDLRRQLKRARQVAVISNVEADTIVFAEGQLEDGNAIDPFTWNVEFISKEKPCPVRSLEAKVRVGGMNHHSIMGAEDAFITTYNADTMRLDIRAFCEPDLSIEFQLGSVTPTLFEEMRFVPSEDLIGWILEQPQERQSQIQLYWQSIIFSGGSANGALSNMEPQRQSQN